MTALLRFCTFAIEYGFYALLFFVPLTMSNETSELFEFNKMWLTFGLTIVIASSWLMKMIITKKYTITRTPFDIPIILFLTSQLIATIFSLDSHVSFWGYYSRFNGGLLATITYIILYYAFVSNSTKKHVIRSIMVTLAAGCFVALWGLPSHFGYDPTCLVFRGNLDVSCWTDQFQPKIRIFSTLGQPAWLAAYLALLLPISMAFFSFHMHQTQRLSQKDGERKTHLTWSIGYLGLTLLLYIDLIFANTRAGFLGFWLAALLFWTLLFSLAQSKKKQYILFIGGGVNILITLIALSQSSYQLFWLVCVLFYLAGIALIIKKKVRPMVVHTAMLLFLTFITITPFTEINQIFTKNLLPTTIQSLTNTKSSPSAPQEMQASQQQEPPQSTILATGITDSGTIRSLVWKGAIDIWKANPLFGSGVETFAFAYYQHRPKEHNLVSEWDYLYNKAHNEYLNYLATTGAFGLGTHLLFLVSVFFLTGKHLLTRTIARKTHEIHHHKVHTQYSNEPLPLVRNEYLLIGLITGVFTILITNFFGFSVVIMNIYLFLIPAFILFLSDSLGKTPQALPPTPSSSGVPAYQWTAALVISGIALYFIYLLFRYWQADVAYALGSNLDKVNQHQDAYPLLHKAVALRADEPVFKDELSANAAVLAAAFAGENDATSASQLAKEALFVNNTVVSQHPNNVVFWKTRVRILYTLGQYNATFFNQALDAIQKAHALAPTDAKISYNLGLIYAQTGDLKKAVAVLEETIRLKPNYIEAYHALALYYRDLALNNTQSVVYPEYQAKAVETTRFIIKNFSADDKTLKNQLIEWGETP